MSLFLGILAAFFFSTTFILNRKMGIEGGYWLWSAILRHFFIFIFFFIWLGIKKEIKPVIKEIKLNVGAWFLWGNVGFTVFYSFICFASQFGPSWLIACLWQMTILAGILLTPFTSDSKKIPVKQVIYAAVIFMGVILVQFSGEKEINIKVILLTMVPMIISTAAYPLGNRKMLQICGDHLSTVQRIFGMILCTMPTWIILSIAAYFRRGLPSAGQLEGSLIVAVFAGVIGTTLFFKATKLAGGDHKKLAAVESTQAAELIFALIGEIILLHGSFPSTAGFIGIAIIIFGIIMLNFRE